MILPTGFALPPLPYLVVLALAVLAVGSVLRRAEPPITDVTVVALAPWMMLGSTLYVCYQLALIPAAISPFFGSPAVYFTTFVVAGLVWLGALRTDSPLRVLAGAGLLLTSVPVALAVRFGVRTGSLTVAWPVAGVVAAVVVAAAVWYGFERIRHEDARATGYAGALAVFAHTLDGISTAVGVDILGFGEQTPASRLIMEFAAQLPTESALGVGWLFVLVKVAVGVIVVAALADYVREDPAEGYLLLAFVAAVGLGPGAHNVLLFIVSNPAGF